ncbi:MAG TPA: hypothetical protein VN253_07385 [Kofleriaceae bacterium]|nr:hypothetical protein [Kofleriaceae bacterium]
MFLGKTLFRTEVPSDDRIDHFWRGDSTPTNALDPVLSRALWKILADHGRHGLRVVVEGTKVYEAATDYTEIGGDEVTDIPFERYLDGWSG